MEIESWDTSGGGDGFGGAEGEGLEAEGEGLEREGALDSGRRGLGLAASWIRLMIPLTRDPSQLVMVLTTPLPLSVELVGEEARWDEEEEEEETGGVGW
jgi:hypothetical protein